MIVEEWERGRGGGGREKANKIPVLNLFRVATCGAVFNN